MRFLDEIRDPKRLKPGITWPRLIAFVLVMIGLAVAAEQGASGRYPTGDCGRKEIDSGPHKEGTCTEDGSTIVVVDRHSVLRLSTLEARLLGVHRAKSLEGPAGSKATHGEFFTFEVALTNRTDSPATVAAGQFMLFLGEPRSEDVEVEKRYEPRSFLAMERPIPPGGTEDGAVVFTLSRRAAPSVGRSGNLDVVNLGTSVSALEPEALFTQSEYGVVRTYQ